jgi:hypothetical protein
MKGAILILPCPEAGHFLEIGGLTKIGDRVINFK